MSVINQNLKKIKFFEYLAVGRTYINNQFYLQGKKKNIEVYNSTIKRTDIINFLIQSFVRDKKYLEIGVRNPAHNFDKIKADIKYSVDPGIEFVENPVDFKMTSDLFFEKLRKEEILSKDIKFDVIYIDGLHLATQVDRDIKNALDFIAEDGFIVLHDCCPPTEWHAREEFYYDLTPAQSFWNGTTWKAFLKQRFNKDVYSCCIDTDWGIGILSKTVMIGKSIERVNEFYEFKELEKDRRRVLNIVTFDELRQIINSQ